MDNSTTIRHDGTIDTDTGPFAIIPEWVLDAPISDRACRLYAILSRYADAVGYAWPSRRTLAERLGRSVDALDRAMRELVDMGMVTVAPRYTDAGDRTSNGYTIARMRPATMPVGSRTNAATGSRTNAATGGRDSAALMRTIGNENQGEHGGAVTGTAPVRARDDVWDAMLAVCGIDPTQITKASRGAYNRAAADLRTIAATPHDIAERAAVFRRRWPDASLTPTSLVRRWPECDPHRQHGPAPLTATEQIELTQLVDAWEGNT